MLTSKETPTSLDNNVITKGTTNKHSVDILELNFYDQTDGTKYRLGDLLDSIITQNKELKALNASLQSNVSMLEKRIETLSYVDELMSYKQASIEVDIQELLDLKLKEKL